MEKRKLLTALLLCCVISTPVFAKDGINVPTGQTETISSNMDGYSGTYGGAVHNEGTLNIDSGVEFTNNFINADSGGGAAIYNNGGTVSGGDNIKFTNNGITNREFGEIIVNGSAGGAIASWNGGTVSLGEGAEFTGNGKNDQGNATWGFGGAIYIDNNNTMDGKLTLGDGAKFSGNMATGAGAIYTGVDAEIGTSEFTGNRAEGHLGGAIYAFGGYDTQINVDIDSSKFSNNYSGTDGGAIANIWSVDTTVATGSEFKNNEAARNGGAIANRGYIDSDGNQLTAQITADGTFENNKAGVNGGAVYNAVDGATSETEKQTYGKAYISGTFKGNEAAGSGGAVYNDAYMEISDATFSGNKAAQGGAVYNTADGAIAMKNVSFSAAADGAKNDIYNAGDITTSGTNTFASDISGNGSIVNSGNNTFAGNNSGYSGTYSHDSENAVTTVTGTFFDGDYTFDKGTLNWDTENDPLGKLVITGSDTNLNIGETQNGILTLKEGSSVADTVTTKINENSTLKVAGGEATLNTGDTWTGKVSISDGTLTIDGITSNGAFNATGGELDIKNSTLPLNTNDSITSAVNANIESSTTLNVDGANLAFDQNDTWAGNINLKTGTLTVDSLTGNGKLAAEGGTVDIIKGELELATDSSIAQAVTTKVNAKSTLNITGGEATIDNSDLWNGKVNMTDGKLTVSGRNDNGALVVEGGDLSIDNSILQVRKDNSIADGANVTLAENSTINIQGGSVSLNDGDKWDGKIVLGTEGVQNDESSLTVGLPAGSSMGKLEANNGALNVLNGLNLDIGEGSYIKEAVAIETSGNINILNGGEVAINDNDILNGGAKVTLTEGGTLNYGKTTDSSAIIEADGGNLNLLANSQLTLTSGSKIDDAVALDIQKDATLTLEQDLNLNLSSEDTWNGKIVNQNGIINANNVTKSSESAALEQSNGELNLYNDSTITLGSNSTISGGDINITKGDDGTNGSVLTVVNANITGGNMVIDENSAFVVKSGTFNLDTLTSSNLVDVMNNQINTSSIGTLTANGQADFKIDILARSNQRNGNDQFVVENPIAGDGTVMVNEWALNGDIYGWDAPIDRHITLNHIFVDKDGNPLEGTIETTDQTTFTPIGWYQLNKNATASGMNYTLDMVKFNPQVFRGQVTTVAQWMNQLNIDDMLFTHSMVLPSFKDEDGGVSQSIMANRYAAESPLFAPYQYSRKDGGLWFKAYGTFENLEMNNGLSRVGNNAYGMLIGADFGLRELRNGWKFMPTAYFGYNGAHQTFARVGAYQNGGQAGFLGTWYKDNFIVGAMAYGGVYNNSMDVFGHTDDTFNYFGGAASKAAYNIRLHRDWVLQPNLFVSYNYFGQQNWHTNFGQMGMMAGDLNGVNIAPGLNLIWEKETFSTYLTLQYMYNINGAVGGRAGNVGLPQMEMERGYIQYGIGFTKKFTDRASGYLQAVLRNVGRTGVGFQAGFNILLGK